jgi:hypothetical protein
LGIDADQIIDQLPGELEFRLRGRGVRIDAINS